jgi:O-antigen ligase
MTGQPTNSTILKGKAQVLFEYVLLALCLCVIALRATFTEGPTMQSSALAENIGDSLYSLSVSAVLILACALWIIWGLWSKRFSFRPTSIEIGLGIFCAAAVVAGFAAADKRLAITTVAVFLAPPLMAILLVQILDSHNKIWLVLATIAALGVVSTYQCAEQFFVSNQLTIEQYERSPQTFLEPLGIEPGTFQQFLFEHRLYSKGVHGFFTTSNSAGSFSLMAAFAAIALFIEKLKVLSFPRRRESILHIALCGIAVAAIIFGLVLTQSKGAIIGTALAGCVSVMLLLFGKWVAANKKVILIICSLLAAAVVWVVISYGLSHGRLPGGSSMLVRWQYWNAAAKMSADHSITGVGPGNFARSYTRYKPPAALESVADPHNFPLSILTQYGPLGLVGFLLMICIPLWRTITFSHEDTKSQRNYKLNKTWCPCAFVAKRDNLALLIIISLVLLFIRPLLMPSTPAATFDVLIYVIVTLYAAPTAVFVLSFLLLISPLPKANPKNERPETRDERQKTLPAVLFGAILGVMLHNLIDFAIFEPPVLTIFWAIIGCIIATYSLQNSAPQLVLKPSSFTRVLLTAAVLAISWCYLNYALKPVAKTTDKVQQAHRAASVGQFQLAHELLDKAEKDDYLSPVSLSLNGRLYLHHFKVTESKNPGLLIEAEKCLQKAILRGKTDFKNFERLTEVYNLLDEISKPEDKTDWLNNAFGSASSAVERYPGCERLHFELAKIAEQLGKTDLAHQEYKEAIEIEDSFRSQFKRMYPGRQIVSRLGEEKYQFAIERISHISNR